MDRPIHIGNVPRRVALLAVLVASCGCNGAFHRRGIPPEPKVTREDAPVQFNSDPNPMGPAIST